METEAMRAAKLEQRLEVLTKGYVTREAALRRSIEATWETLQAALQVPFFLRHDATGESSKFLLACLPWL